ncbi:MAG: glycogen debranching protein GlgX [Verrucomicrobia bacterium]|nr:glycogen debranching protein GlgX [Verrucomicrobiota bacterium]
MSYHRPFGTPHPLGVTLENGGANFSIYSRSATRVELLFFDHPEDLDPSRVECLDPGLQRTYHYWHAFVPGLTAGDLYAWRITGPYEPQRGHRFDPSKALLDPYGKGVVIPRGYDRLASSVFGERTIPMKSVITDTGAYDWEGDVPPRRPTSRTLIYEMHVRGMTRHPTSGVDESRRGTYAALIEKIPYLKDLGITAVELLPVFAFDAQDAPPGRTNYWGYAPVSFFAPHPAYSSDPTPLGPLNEFRDMVKAMHRAGIEVILDVVYNHTAEGGAEGPTLGLRGIENYTYYLLERDRSQYLNYSGTGNTLHANHPVVRRLIVDSLRFWVDEMHVDGFRFDLASILARDAGGHILPNPPVLWDIETDPSLAGVKLIAEAWDAAGLYQVGSFIGDSWKEWNGRFRDDVRDFFRGERGAVRRIADRMLGSPELYGHKQREAEQSVNFVTCHDGFTLNDLVSYSVKRNGENGEDNRDGSDDNRSWNCGVEGPTDDPEIEALRNRQVKNFLSVTMLSLGIPMILMGDEMRRSQGGNNNAYCQDDETSWLDWSLLERHAGLHRFVKLLAARRQLRDLGREGQCLGELIREADIVWHGVRCGQPDWSDDSHSLSFTAEVRKERMRFHYLMNAWHGPIEFELPCGPGGVWHRWIDTSLPSPQDIVPWREAPPHEGGTYRLEGHSVAALYSMIEPIRPSRGETQPPPGPPTPR